MTDYDERIRAALVTASEDLRVRPSFGADVRRGATRRRDRRRVTIVGAGVLTAVAMTTAYVLAAQPASTPPPVPSTATASSTSASPPGPLFPGRCAIDRLPIPGNPPRSLVTGGDRTGRYLLGRAYASAGFVKKHKIVVWDNGQPTALDMPGEDERLSDINSAGVAVGNSFSGDTEVPYIYRDATVTKLNAQGSSEPSAIGEQGVIVGFRTLPSSDTRPVVWRTPNGPQADLSLPAGYHSGRAIDVDDDGTIIGSVNGGGDDTRGIAWTLDGTGRLLPLPTIDGAPALFLYPNSIHHGVVAGVAGKAEGTSVENIPVLYDLRTNRFTVLPQRMGYEAANTLGWVAGQMGHSLVLAAPTAQTPLPGLTTAQPTGRLADLVVSMSEDGRVLGGQASSNGDPLQYEAVRWRCT
jgi:hypothetical protein